jgi:hypothetical protein
MARSYLSGTLLATSLFVCARAYATEPFVFGGYVEAAYQWNFNAPSNRVTAFRGFDARHNELMLSNVALDAQWDWKGVVGRVTLQAGLTPNIYYASERYADVVKYIQQAYAGYRIPVGRGLLAQFGVFLSPIGPENMPVKDDWNWSRSNLFFGLPFYHLGGKLSYAFSDEFTLTAGVFNGWNNLTDNNLDKSIMLHATYVIPDRVSLSVLYFTGNERPAGTSYGWRHLFDAHVTARLSPWLEAIVHLDGGLEPAALGVNGWAAAAVSLRAQPITPLYVGVRADVFYDKGGIAWPVPWVAEVTATVDYRLFDHASIRLEYRHDHAARAIYYGGAVTADIANRVAQDTLTLGVVAWF